jgi:hypothetical protein
MCSRPFGRNRVWPGGDDWRGRFRIRPYRAAACNGARTKARRCAGYGRRRRHRADRLPHWRKIRSPDGSKRCQCGRCRGSASTSQRAAEAAWLAIPIAIARTQYGIRASGYRLERMVRVLDELALAWRCAWVRRCSACLCIGGAHRRPRVPPCASDRAARLPVVRTPGKRVQFIGMRSTMGGGPLTR